SFVNHGGTQCGYCTPGVLLTANALLREEPDADRERIREALSGNLCRCTGYQQIVDSVEDALWQSRVARETVGQSGD
ncbi:MAG: 2Fe-2S iron-sulfur cluster-binding protein, partial [Woeseiaceae bacterium]|nr:2Fe-2S iron-sulfur cluster-binding protein [Woeseiaceae bacterium]